MSTGVDLSLLDAVLQKHKGEDDALITVLQEIQGIYSYLPEEALVHLSRETRIPMNRIYAVVTFYAQFHLEPRGRNTIRVCQGTACHVQGCESVVTALEDALGIEVGGTSDDLEFSLESVACLGTCFLAPVMMINDSYHGKLDSQKAKATLASFGRRKEEPQG